MYSTRFRLPGLRASGPALAFAVALAVLAAGCSGSSTPKNPTNPPPPGGPTISAVTAAAITSSSATISWATSTAADSQVDYGTTSAYGQSTPLDSARTTSHAVSLTGLTPSTLYHFRVKSKNASGNLATSADSTFTTSARNNTGPVVSGITVTNITATAAAIGWTTDKPSDSQVDYGPTPAYGSSSALDSNLATSHSIALSGLTASTLYHFRVKSRDSSGNLATSGDATFTTLGGPDSTPPTVTLTAPASGATLSGSVTVSADASDNVGVAGVQFLLDGTNLGAEVTSAPYSTTWDTTTATNGQHTVTARARDAAGNQATSAVAVVTVSNGSGLKLDLDLPVKGFTLPLDLQEPPDGSGRLFVLEQTGAIKIIVAAQVLPTPFLEVSTRPGFTSGGETGLLGLAFHPNYAVNGHFYVNYTRNVGGQLQTVIAEYTASPASSNVVDPASERILFTWNQPFANHNGGGLAFGPDGLLYIGLGDGGSGGDPLCNAQNLGTILGKLLRIDVTTPPPAGQQYVIPPGNPFASQPGARGEIFLYGLRNPFRFSFDRANPSDMYIGDVGQDAFEEIDLVNASQAGTNMGWNLFEGTHPYPASTCSITGSAPLGPIFDYSHSNGDESVIGGYVYRGDRIPALSGMYVFGDFISGRVWALSRNAQGQWTRSDALLNMGANNLSSFGQTQDGELWVVRYTTGEVAHIKQAAAAERRPRVK